MGKRLWLRLAPFLVLALAAGAGAAFLVAGAVRTPPPTLPTLPVDTNPVPLAGHTVCAGVELSFDTDQAMTQASKTFSGDPKARRVFVETKAEAYALFKEIFKDNPELLRSVGPDALPASVILLPVPGVELKAYAAELKQRYPGTAKVQTLDGDALSAKAPPDKRLPACPRAGEY
ncbi:permease-like cell division protein FtsX [Amycolatopsis sp. NBC_00345]|uniref:permease-like cell division protein FtsX n=1 Tax=Amycolatopsis sp. NBC_00345 TaxID=2975955 RepID=UPI002E25ABFA